MIPLYRTAVGFVAVLLLAGCGGSHSAVRTSATKHQPAPQPASSSSQHGFLAQASNGAIFIQWTRTGDTVRGTLSEAYTDQSDPTKAQGESHSFTGVVSGSDITLTLDGGDNWNGTLNGSSLTLSYTSSDGTLQSFDFHPASVADYNAAVGNVQAGANESQQGQTIDADVSTVNGDLLNLNGHLSSARSDLADFSTDLAAERADVATTKADLAKTLTLSGYDLCDQAYTTQDDAYTVQDDVYTINNHAGNLRSSFGGDLDSAESDISSLRSDFAKLRSDRAALPSYHPAGAPTAGQAGSAILSALGAIASIDAKTKVYVAQGNTLLKTANGYAAQAQAACNKSGG